MTNVLSTFGAYLLFHQRTLEPSVLSEFQWSWEASITMPLAALLVVYLLGAIRRGNGLKLLRYHLCFIGSWASLFFALCSPIHSLGEELFSVHMLQHEILILISAPLLAGARPAVTLLWAIAPRNRARVGRFFHRVQSFSIVRTLSSPLSTWILEALALWLWHLPMLYQATLRSDWLHAAQHLSFFVSATLFWSALYGSGRSAMSYGKATVYVFATAAHCSALGALLTFSSVLWYPAYTTAQHPWNITPLEDQQLGGLLMWVPSGVVFLAIGLILFARWVQLSERRIALTSLPYYASTRTKLHD